MNKYYLSQRAFIDSFINTKNGYKLRLMSDISILNDILHSFDSDESARREIIEKIESNVCWHITRCETCEQEVLSVYYKYQLVDYNIGYILLPISNINEVEIVHLHNDSPVKGLAEALIISAIKNGGTRLSHFEGPLSEFYEKHCFEQFGYLKWDRCYAPDEWDDGLYGQPDIIMRRLKP